MIYYQEYHEPSIITTDNTNSYYPLGINYDNYNEEFKFVYEYDDGIIVNLIGTLSIQ